MSIWRMDNNEKLRQKTDQRREVMQLKQRNSRDCSFQKQYTLKDIFYLHSPCWKKVLSKGNLSYFESVKIVLA